MKTKIMLFSIFACLFSVAGAIETNLDTHHYIPNASFFVVCEKGNNDNTISQALHRFGEKYNPYHVQLDDQQIKIINDGGKVVAFFNTAKTIIVVHTFDNEQLKNKGCLVQWAEDQLDPSAKSKAISAKIVHMFKPSGRQAVEFYDQDNDYLTWYYYDGETTIDAIIKEFTGSEINVSELQCVENKALNGR